ncbi:MAG TPA: hypothetical protein PLF61_04090 [Candidatus Goldiibacteriota bacterium]|nr:hypothetical protein [Candidatus Goldiibacteriota bacterium]
MFKLRFNKNYDEKGVLMFKKILFTMIPMIAFMATAFAADSDTLGGSFADDGISARPAGMAGAFTAIADDGNSSWWNPAGVGLLGKRKSIAFTYIPNMYGLTTGNINRMLLSYGQGDMSGYGGLGASISYLNVNLGSDFTGDTEPQWTEYVILLSWGMEIEQFIGMQKYKYPKIAIGVNAKYFSLSTDLKVGDGKTGASGFGADAGLIIVIKNNFNLGVMAKNIFTSVSWTGASDERLPYALNGGFFYGITPDFIISAEVKSEESDSGKPRITAYCGGAEYRFNLGKNKQVQSIMLRAGASIDPNADSYIISGGTSIAMDTFSIDYAYQFFIKSLLTNDVHRLGLTVYF